MPYAIMESRLSMNTVHHHYGLFITLLVNLQERMLNNIKSFRKFRSKQKKQLYKNVHTGSNERIKVN